MGESKLLTYIKILLNSIFIIVGVLVFVLLVPKILRFFMPFVIGWIVAMIANPLVRFLEKKVKILRKHSSAIIIIVVIAALVGGMYALISFLIREIYGLYQDLPIIVEQLSIQFDSISARIGEYSEYLPGNAQVVIDSINNSLASSINQFIDNIDPSMSTAGALAQGVADIFLIVIVTVLSAYFFTVDRDKIVNNIKKTLPQSVISGWGIIADNFKTAFGGYFKAQFKIMLILIVIMFIGFEILNIGYSFLIGLGIAFLDVLPVFGTGAVLWPWALLDMISGNYFRAVGLVIIYLVCQVVKQILQPKMVGDSIGVSPLATLIFMYIGYRFQGVIGMILGIPVGMVIVNLYRIGMFDRIIKGFEIIIHDFNEFRKF
ncbi:MAG: sporulation integral membrane protein YtvI [Clostridiales bacterium]|nr:sporulation integral membrane protein YtvI [Clostridiales bacterium]